MANTPAESGQAPSTSSGRALRTLAEEKAALAPEPLELLSPEEVRQALNELRVHQIELEIQNEELRWTQAELEASRTRYFDLYDLAPVGYFTLSETGLILEANLTAATLLGVMPGDLVNHSLTRFILSEDQDVYYQHRKQLSATGAPQACDLRLVNNSGGLFWARVEAAAALHADGTLVCRTVVSNITTLKQAEDDLRSARESLLEANRELQQAIAREQQLAFTDALTGVNNQHSLIELASRMYDVATRYQHPLSILMFDIDNFKEVNDSFGHGVGDRILEQIAHVADAGHRSADIIGRYGGDEFVMVLPMTTARQAFPVAERLRASVTAIRTPTPHGDAAVTLSIGIAETFDTAEDETVAHVINRADEAMYMAKQAGRNQTVLYSATTSGKEQMMTTNTLPVETLRLMAEERLREHAGAPNALSCDAHSSQPHDLRVRKIETEVELQSEELRRRWGKREASRVRYFDLYDLAPVGFFTMNEQGLILEANLAVATMLGVARGALIRQQLICFILPEDQDLYYRHRKQLVATRTPQVCELRLVKRDGTQFRARLEATAAQGADGTPEYRALLSDISQRKPVAEGRWG